VGARFAARICRLEEIMRRIVTAFLAVTIAAGLGLVQPAQAAKSLTVFAAASLTEYLQEVEAAFEKEHRGTDVRLNLAASSRLRIQIEHGGPADVFLSADTSNMDPLLKAKLVEKPAVFAHNRLVVGIPKRNPAGLKSPGDLSKPKVKLVIAAPETPIGEYTRDVIRKMDASGKYGKGFGDRTLANVVSNEPTVKAVVAKVNLGEADAGICYASDITPAIRGNVSMIDIPDDVNIIADYPIAVLKGSRQASLAKDFMEFVLSPKGQSLLEKHGFVAARPTR